jgi:hypothetical protein
MLWKRLKSHIKQQFLTRRKQKQGTVKGRIAVRLEKRVLGTLLPILKQKINDFLVEDPPDDD